MCSKGLAEGTLEEVPGGNPRGNASGYARCTVLIEDGDDPGLKPGINLARSPSGMVVVRALQEASHQRKASAGRMVR